MPGRTAPGRRRASWMNAPIWAICRHHGRDSRRMDAPGASIGGPPTERRGGARERRFLHAPSHDDPATTRTLGGYRCHDRTSDRTCPPVETEFGEEDRIGQRLRWERTLGGQDRQGDCQCECSRYPVRLSAAASWVVSSSSARVGRGYCSGKSSASLPPHTSQSCTAANVSPSRANPIQ